MRIVYVLNSLGVGGAERLATALARRMALRGHATAMLVLRPQDPGDLPCAAPVVSLDMSRNPARVAAGLVRARRFLSSFRPDVVHSHSFHANLVARMVPSPAPGAVVLSTIHNVYEGGWLRMLGYRLTDGRSQRTVAVSAAVAQRLVERGVIARGKCTVIPNAIEVEDFAPDAERRARTRAAMGVTDEFVWLAAGRDAPAKDYPTLLRAFERVVRACPHARLWIAGAAIPQSGVVRSLAVRGDLCGAVRWLGMREDVAALLDAADGFAMSSAWEGMPLAVAEAMAMEKPVVATDVGGVRELVGTAGASVPCRNPEALADAMLAAMRQSPVARAAVGRDARQRILDEFNIGTRTGQWEELYRLAIERR